MKMMTFPTRFTRITIFTFFFLGAGFPYSPSAEAECIQSARAAGIEVRFAPGINALNPAAQNVLCPVSDPPFWLPTGANASGSQGASGPSTAPRVVLIFAGNRQGTGISPGQARVLAPGPGCLDAQTIHVHVAVSPSAPQQRLGGLRALLASALQRRGAIAQLVQYVHRSQAMGNTGLGTNAFAWALFNISNTPRRDFQFLAGPTIATPNSPQDRKNGHWEFVDFATERTHVASPVTNGAYFQAGCSQTPPTISASSALRRPTPVTPPRKNRDETTMDLTRFRDLIRQCANLRDELLRLPPNDSSRTAFIDQINSIAVITRRHQSSMQIAHARDLLNQHRSSERERAAIQFFLDRELARQATRGQQRRLRTQGGGSREQNEALRQELLSLEEFLDRSVTINAQKQPCISVERFQTQIPRLGECSMIEEEEVPAEDGLGTLQNSQFITVEMRMVIRELNNARNLLGRMAGEAQVPSQRPFPPLCTAIGGMTEVYREPRNATQRPRRRP